MAAPSYNRTEYSMPSSPPYNPSATDGERILELRPSLTMTPSRLPDEYVFRSQRMKLDLGARIWPTSAPCYGYTGSIEGIISVTTLDHVKSVKVTLEGLAKASFMERGVLAGHIESSLFKKSVTLYTRDSPTATTSYPLSITFPSTGDNSTESLPPSFVQYFPGVSAEIRYRVRIDMSRSGLRRRESLLVPILYLPRSYTPPRIRPPLFGNRTSIIPEDDQLKELHLIPKPIVAKPSKKGQAPPCEKVEAKIALPHPLVVTSGERIPFVLTIQSQSPALAALYTNVTLQLIKVIKIKAYEKTSFREVVMSAGEVYDAEQRGDGVQVLRGELGNGAPGKEASWTAAGLVEVKHILRLSIKPLACTTAVAANVPMFEGAASVTITTHGHGPDMDATAPALGLVGINAA